MILEGQKHPVTGYLSKDGEKFELIDGEIRYWAWAYARDNLHTDLDEAYGGLECQIGPRDGNSVPDAIEIAYYQIGCGTDSVPLTALDIATKIAEIHPSKPVAEIAKRMRCSEQHVRDMLKLAKVDDGMKAAVRGGKISPTTAVRVSKATEDTQREVMAKVSSGERVKGSDIEEKEPSVLSRDAIQKQMKKAEGFFYKEKTEKGRMYYKGMTDMALIVLGHKEGL